MRQGITLLWAPRAGAQQYRVEILAPGGSEVLQRHVVAGPHHDVDDVPPTAIWRVYCSADGESWEPHIPAVSLPLSPAGPVTEVDWDASGAPAYRMLVRDDAENRVVLKEAVIGPPAAVSWRELIAEHPHRVRVQEWRSDAWLDLTPYRPLVPPADVALRRRPAKRSGPALGHAVLVTLSGGPVGHQHGERRPSEWWKQRLGLLGDWTVSALSSRSSPADTWLVVCDAAVSDDDVEALRGRWPDAVVSASEVNAIRAALERTAEAAEMLAVTRLMAGDRPHPALGDSVHQHAAELVGRDNRRRLIAYPLSVRVDRERGSAHLERHFTAPLHTVLVPAGDPDFISEALDPSRPFIDDCYRKVDDTTVVATLRSWPGPNGLSPLHGQHLVALGAQEALASFDLTGPAKLPAASSRV